MRWLQYSSYTACSPPRCCRNASWLWRDAIGLFVARIGGGNIISAVGLSPLRFLSRARKKKEWAARKMNAGWKRSELTKTMIFFSRIISFPRMGERCIFCNASNTSHSFNLFLFALALHSASLANDFCNPCNKLVLQLGSLHIFFQQLQVLLQVWHGQ